MKSTLPQRMRQAAETLEELSALYGYLSPTGCKWSPAELRREAVHVEDEQR